MELAEIDKEIARLQSLRSEAEKQAALQASQKNYDEAVETIRRVVTDLNRLHETGYLPPRLLTALADGGGKFNPGRFIKKPQRPR